MSKLLSEEKVLKKLNIDSFRNLTKDKVITMTSLLDKMDPEVAKKAIEQFPEFSETSKEILTNYKDTLDKSLKSNEESVKEYYDSCDSIIKSLQKELESEELTFEEKKYVFEKMFEVSRMIGEKDSQNKGFISVMAALGVTAVGIVVGGLFAALGGSANFTLKD